MFKLNVFANLLGSIILFFLPTISLPLYLNVLNDEKYGLFTLYFIIIIYFRVLDLGLTATFNRYVSLKHNIDNGKLFIRDLLKNYEIIFLIISFFIFVLIFIFNDYFTNKWIISNSLSKKSISYSITIISLIIGLRFFLTLYRSGINGFEKQVWLNSVRVFFETISIFGGLVFCYVINYFIEFKIYYLFLYFIFFNILELLILRTKILNLINVTYHFLYFSFNPLLKTYKAMILLGTTGSLWFFVLSFDRLIFSRILNLKEYGYYVSVTILSSMCLLVVVTINTALLPRITNLFSLNSTKKFKSTFQSSFSLNMCLGSSLTIILCLYAEQILIVWTGNSKLAAWGHNVLMIYSVGYFFISLVHTLTTYFTAIGKLKIITIANLFWAPVLIFLYLISAIYFNYIYAGFSWVLCNFILFIFLFTSIFVYENIYIEKIQTFFNILKILIISILVFCFFNYFFIVSFYSQRLMMLIQIFLVYGIVLTVLLISLRETRSMIYYIYKHFKLFFLS